MRARPNEFGCFEVGDPCASEDQCCSGICKGKKGKKRCRAHDVRVCTAKKNLCTTEGEAFCGGSNPNCACAVTTGNAPFCGDFTGFPTKNLCRDCQQDADCQEEFGPGAACVVYSGLCDPICPDTGRACVPACSDTAP